MVHKNVKSKIQILRSLTKLNILIKLDSLLQKYFGYLRGQFFNVKLFL